MAELPEERIREIVRDELYASIEDQRGRAWSVPFLERSFGITRRQALAVFGLLATGYTLNDAVREATPGPEGDAVGPASTGMTNTPVSTDSNGTGTSVPVAETAADIQRHIDDLAFDGGSVNVTAADDVAGGLVMLGRKVYKPTEPIQMKRGVTLRGIHNDWPDGRLDNRHSYSVINGERIPEGEPIIQFGNVNEVNQANASALENVVVHGEDNNVHGIKVVESGQIQIDGCQVGHVGGHGVSFEGAFSCHLLRTGIINAGTAENKTYALRTTNGPTTDRNTNIVTFRCMISSFDERRNTLVHTVGGANWTLTQVGMKLVGPKNVPVVKHEGGRFGVKDSFITGEGEASIDCIHTAGPSLDLNNVTLEKQGRGIVVTGGLTRLPWSRIEIKLMQKHAIDVRGGAPAPIVNADIHDNGGDGVRISRKTGSVPIHIGFTNFEGNGGYAIHDARDAETRNASHKVMIVATRKGQSNESGFVNDAEWDTVVGSKPTPR